MFCTTAQMSRQANLFCIRKIQYQTDKKLVRARKISFGRRRRTKFFPLTAACESKEVWPRARSNCAIFAHFWLFCRLFASKSQEKVIFWKKPHCQSTEPARLRGFRPQCNFFYWPLPPSARRLRSGGDDALHGHVRNQRNGLFRVFRLSSLSFLLSVSNTDNSNTAQISGLAAPPRGLLSVVCNASHLPQASCLRSA